MGGRQFADVGFLRLESGETLPDVRMAYETWGTFTGDNAVLVLHALTGDSHVHGPTGPGHASPGWWDGVVGPGLAVDTDRWFVVAPNILGGCQGTTGPATTSLDGLAYGSRFPHLTVRDQVRAEVALSDLLGIEQWACVMGGSAGGMRAVEWAIEHPARVERLFLLASSAQASAEQIALSTAQQSAILADAHFNGGDYYGNVRGPVAGLEVARQVAHIAYRSEPELQQRFGRATQPDPTRADTPSAARRPEEFAVASYLRHHGEKLVRRFDANSYLVLTRAMDSHDVARGRGSVTAALSRISARTVVVGIDSDRLYPLYQQAELAELIPGCVGLDVIDSLYGHDGFLVESEAVGKLAAGLLSSP